MIIIFIQKFWSVNSTLGQERHVYACAEGCVTKFFYAKMFQSKLSLLRQSFMFHKFYMEHILQELFISYLTGNKCLEINFPEIALNNTLMTSKSSKSTTILKNVIVNLLLFTVITLIWWHQTCVSHAALADINTSKNNIAWNTFPFYLYLDILPYKKLSI